MHRTKSIRFNILLAAACAVLALTVWLSSGTLAPYAATLQMPRIEKPCNYLLNTDHVHFEACFLMLDGAPRERWDYSIYLRRILYPLAAYPFMKAFGFLIGGVVASILIQVIAFAGFVIYVRRRIGATAGYAAMALLVTYPGIHYWAGLPYCHAMIVPASLAGMMLLWELDRAAVNAASTLRTALLALGLGILFLAYDLLPIFAPAALLILLLRKRPGAAAAAVPMLVLPTIATALILWQVYGLPLRNKNTQTYYDLVEAYRRAPDLARWATLAGRAPMDFVRVYFFSNFTFLPALFAAVWLISRLTMKLRLTLAERALLAAGLALFAFINLAPPTPGWQFRGSQIVRIYQPVFPAMVLFCARVLQASPRRWLIGLIGVTVFMNGAVVLGPVLRLRLADQVYFAFYRHADGPKLSQHLDTFGRRPLGFCDPSITIENAPPKKKLPQKPVKKPAKKKRRPPANTPPTTLTAPSTTAPSSLPSAPSTAAAPSHDG